MTNYNIVKSHHLTSNNSFGIEAVADYYFEFDNNNEIIDFIHNQIDNYNPVRILGSGCNILFSNQRIEGLVLKSKDCTVEKISENETTVTLRVGAGYDWDSFVLFTLENRLYGLENLSGIPGSVGASPVQNIGAYGTEVEQFITGVDVIDLKTGKMSFLSHKDCQFGYRNSIFKSPEYKDIFITHVHFRLLKKPNPNLSYFDIKSELSNIKDPSPIAIRNAVLKIRNSKLPDYKILGNAGSFFKNPVLNKIDANRLINLFPEIKYWVQENGSIKFSAAFLIDKSGLKGFTTESGAGVYEYQPLIIVNRGNATGNDIIELAKNVVETVYEKFGVELEPEVNIW